MTLAPRFLVNLWTGLKVAHFARRQKALGRGGAAQRAAFAARLAATAGTEFARLHGLDATTTYAHFREKVPVRTYEWFEPFIRRMAAGEAGILVPGKCPLFVETAGTQGVGPKLLPVPDAMLAHFRQAQAAALYLYVHRAGQAGVFLGRHLRVGASTRLAAAGGAQRTSLDGVLALGATPWEESNLRSPGAAVAELPEGPEKIAATAQAMLRSDVTLLSGTPALAWALAVAARDLASAGGRRAPHLQAIWPNLECFMYAGAPLGFFAEALRAALGPAVSFHEVYAAAEGIFAAQDAGTPAALRVLPDTGIFFEFLPQAGYNEGMLAKAGPQCVPLDAVETGVNYIPVVTTPAGLVRYATGDIVRFTALNPPRLQFVGRSALELNTLGEHVSEREVLDTLQAVCARNGWQAIAFHVAPYAQRSGAGQVAHVHEWWLELGTHTMKTPTANVLGPEFDAELALRNREYAARRANGTLGAPLVRLVMPGVFQSWAREQNKTGSASKLPRCRSDRLIADQLAALAPFHQATIAPFKPNGVSPGGTVIG
jgi:hypothetical protein